MYRKELECERVVYMFQQYICAGNLGVDPEMKYTPNGDPICKLFVIVNTGKDKTLPVNVATWGKLAESCNQYLKRGDQVVISGELSEPYAYVDKEGKPHARLEVVARVVKFGKRTAADNGNRAAEAIVETEEIPF